LEERKQEEDKGKRIKGQRALEKRDKDNTAVEPVNVSGD